MSRLLKSFRTEHDSYTTIATLCANYLNDFTTNMDFIE